jgi:prolyl-tRNA synthetase
LLDDIQTNLYNRAKAFRDEHITRADTWEEFEKVLDEKTGSFRHTGMELPKQKQG